MAALTNAKHERFVQELTKGKSQVEAYEIAGYRPSRSAASRLAEDVNICKRLAELQERAAVRVEMTVADILEELEQARQIAIKAQTPQASAMVTATMGKAKLLGMITDKGEISGPNGAPIPITEIRRTIVDPRHTDA